MRFNDPSRIRHAERPTMGPAAGRRAGPARGGASTTGSIRRPGERYQVVVHVDAVALADRSSPPVRCSRTGRAFSAETSRACESTPAACDAARRDGRTVADSSGGLGSKDDSARVGGCGAPPIPSTRAAASRLRAPVRAGPSPPSLGAGGPTMLSNLALLCRPPPPRGPRGGLSGRSTDLERRASVPPTGWPAAAEVPGAHHSARGSGPGPPRAARRTGLRLHARTACPSWLGERLHLGYAIAVCIPGETDSRDRSRSK